MAKRKSRSAKRSQRQTKKKPTPSKKKNKHDDQRVKELENRFWAYFWIIKSFITVIIFILLFIFVRRLILLAKGM